MAHLFICLAQFTSLLARPSQPFIMSLKGDLQHVNGEGDVRLGDAHRRFDAKDISAGTALADDQSHGAAVLEDAVHLLDGHRHCRPVIPLLADHQLQTNHQSLSANVADNVRETTVSQFSELPQQQRSHSQRVLLQLLRLDDIEHGGAHRRGERIAAKGVEVHRPRQRARHRLCGDDGGQRKAIADALCHGHNVWDDAVALKTPEVLPGPPETGLYLVADEETATGLHQLVGALQEALWVLDGAADA